MNIGIFTITDGENYGNRLQNYAMQTVLEEKGHNVKTLKTDYYTDHIDIKIKLFIKKHTNIKNNKFSKRINAFKKFNKEYIKFEKEIVRENAKFSKLDKYDCFVVGSDQVWNPNFPTTSGNSFLKFAVGKKKVAIAASFGVDAIDEENVNSYIENLKTFDAISVREQSGNNIVRKLLNHDVRVLLDPTLMLGREEWDRIAKKPKCIHSNNFCLCYLLGNQEKAVINKIREYAVGEDMNIVFMENDTCQLGVSTDESFSFNPSEFVWLISHCNKVITDSFHAVIFGMIFQKRLIAIPRDISLGNMNNRLTDLAEEFKIKNLISYDYDFSNEAEMDFDLIESVLTAKKKQFNDFLDKNL